MATGLGFYSGLLEGMRGMADIEQSRAATRYTSTLADNAVEDQSMQRQRFPLMLEADALGLEKNKLDIDNAGLERLQRQIELRAANNALEREEYEKKLLANMQVAQSVPASMEEQADGNKLLAQQNRAMGQALMKVDPLKAQKYFDAANQYESTALTRAKAALQVKEEQANAAGSILSNISNQEDLNRALPELTAVGFNIPEQFRNWNDPRAREWLTKQALRSPVIAKELQDTLSFMEDEEALAVDKEQNKIRDEQLYNRSLRERAAAAGIKIKAGKQSSINTRFNDRIIGATMQATQDIENISKLPLQVTSFGGFLSEDTGPLSATKDMLTRELTESSNKRYDAMMSGIERSLGLIESQGMAPSGSLTKSFEKLKAVPGDDVLTRLTKMALLRQNVEVAVDQLLDKPGIPDQQKETLKGLQDRLKSAVPFTVQEINALEAVDDKDFTLGELIKKGGVSAIGKTYDDPEKERRYQEWKAKQLNKGK